MFQEKEISIKILAVTYQDLAIHKNMCDRQYKSTWTITHIATGMALWNDLESRAEAKKLVQYLYENENIDWNIGASIIGWQTEWGHIIHEARWTFEQL